MTGETRAGANPVATDMARLAAAWLGGLDDEQRAVGWWGGPGGKHEAERRRWFYTPTDHGGLPLNGQSDRQQRQVLELVASGLSPRGYDLVSTVLGTENILDRVEGFRSEFDTSRGRDPSRYYLRVFGDPEGHGPWGWRFGGHHVSLNFLIAAGQVRSTTPRFFGLDPAVTTFPGGARLDPLGEFQSAARELVTSLPAEARAVAVLHPRAPADLVLGNRSSFTEGATMMPLPDLFRRRPGDDELQARMRAGGDARDREIGYGRQDHELVSVTATPKGISAADLDRSQQECLDRLVRTYHDSLPDALVPSWEIEKLHFAWAGPTEVGAPNYYRIQGEGILIEWDNTARHGNHAHSVVRHLSNDFGADVLARHRRRWH
ncbi:DUF3500 domain-containing protein [Amycolatopsis ultiminotia]|uniref:DUF3500 domain-containing protein n=1 Tax=Amycolatopsis ultiminotia TaxID=543629 RepID=A0ABP6W1V0_9PSEU